jgi:hypothetical protein
MSERRRIRRPAPQPVPQESLPEGAVAGTVVEKTRKVTLDLRESVAERLNSNAYVMHKKVGEFASDLLDRGMRPLKADKKWHTDDTVSQGQESEVA